jgi:CTP:molybdopterin cytidylyltransferase MocA
MRTTVTLDADVASMLEEAMHRERRPFKAIINDAIRRGLAPRAATRAAKPHRVVVHHCELMPGIDPGSLNRLAGELEDDAVLRKAVRR